MTPYNFRKKILRQTKTEQLQKNIKTLQPLRWLGVIFLAGNLLTSIRG